MHMKKRALFIDRDGTIIVEPQDTYQIDSLDRLQFVPDAVAALGEIATRTGYELVMVTNQDGLGTASFPEEIFEPPHAKMIETLAEAGVQFSEVLIDRSFAHENLPTRKPGTGMLTRYMSGDYDLKHSFVIGDRVTDIQLAANLGAQGIFIGQSPCEGAVLVTREWSVIAKFLIDAFEGMPGVGS